MFKTAFFIEIWDGDDRESSLYKAFYTREDILPMAPTVKTEFVDSSGNTFTIRSVYYHLLLRKFFCDVGCLFIGSHVIGRASMCEIQDRYLQGGWALESFDNVHC
jgi:hypothetical protein